MGVFWIITKVLENYQEKQSRKFRTPKRLEKAAEEYYTIKDKEKRFDKYVKESKRFVRIAEFNLCTAHGQVEFLNAFQGSNLQSTNIIFPKTFLYAMIIYAMNNPEFRSTIKEKHDEVFFKEYIKTHKEQIRKIGVELYKNKFTTPNWLNN